MTTSLLNPRLSLWDGTWMIGPPFLTRKKFVNEISIADR